MKKYTYKLLKLSENPARTTKRRQRRKYLKKCFCFSVRFKYINFQMKTEVKFKYTKLIAGIA